MKVVKQARMLLGLASLLIGIGVFSSSAAAQDVVATPPPTKPAGMQPHIADLKGVSVGMTRDEVKGKLGGPETSDKTGMYYSFSKSESAQIGLDAEGKVRTIAIIYTNGDKGAPSFADVFGTDVTADTRENGDIYKLVRYPDAGVYVSYSQTGVKDKPMTVVTMRQMLSN